VPPDEKKRPRRHGQRGRPKPKTRRAAKKSAPDGVRIVPILPRRGGARPKPVDRRAALDDLTRELEWSRPPEPKAPRPAGTLAPTNFHILMVGWEYPPLHSGGLGVASYELCRELGQMGHQITFLTPFSGPFAPTPGTRFLTPHNPVDRLEFPNAYEPWFEDGRPFSGSMESYNAWIGSLAGPGTFDLVHVHDWFGTVGAATLARRWRRPLVMTVHSTAYDRTLGFPDAEILGREQHGLKSADRVIAVSRHLKGQLIERYGVPPEKIRVVYNAVRPPERLLPVARSARTILYLGRLAAMKNVDTFLQAAARVAPAMPDSLFVVAGEGPEYPHLLTLSAHLGISDRVLFLGHVTEDERTVLLASASVFVLPSVVEPFGIAALEAMVAGTPTIVSKTSGVAEVADSVFSVDFWDTEEFASRIAELIQYPILRRVMGENGRQQALLHGWRERAMETAVVYAELVRGEARGR
jgi:glycogen synthase